MLKISGPKKKRVVDDCQRQPFTVFLVCQDCDEQIEVGDELVDVQVDVTKREGINTRLLLVTGPSICPTCKNLKVVE